jgi:hypothetical protein
MNDHVAVAVDGGFWVIGVERQADAGFVRLDECSMLYGFSGQIHAILSGLGGEITLQPPIDGVIIPVNAIKLIIPTVLPNSPGKTKVTQS